MSTIAKSEALATINSREAVIAQWLLSDVQNAAFALSEFRAQSVNEKQARRKFAQAVPNIAASAADTVPDFFLGNTAHYYIVGVNWLEVTRLFADRWTVADQRRMDATEAREAFERLDLYAAEEAEADRERPDHSWM